MMERTTGKVIYTRFLKLDQHGSLTCFRKSLSTLKYGLKCCVSHSAVGQSGYKSGGW